MKKTVKAEKREEYSQKTKGNRLTQILVCLAVLTSICAIVLAVKVIPQELEIAAAGRELDVLPQLPKTSTVVWSVLNTYEEKMRGINPDYVGLLTIEGMNDFPVVRGNDNEKYLSTSYVGDENILGAIFMDYRCAGEDEPHIIIYGHNATDLSGNSYFFNGLSLFLDEKYMSEHPIITFIENDYLYEFKIFSARITDINDPAYQLDFSQTGVFETFLERNGAPPDAVQILTLSTCYVAGGDDGRIVVQGVRRNVWEVDKMQTMVAEYVRH